LNRQQQQQQQQVHDGQGTRTAVTALQGLHACNRFPQLQQQPIIERVISLLSASPVGEARCRCRKVWLTRIDYYYYYLLLVAAAV
jgi:hypothetical protein